MFLQLEMNYLLNKYKASAAMHLCNVMVAGRELPDGTIADLAGVRGPNAVAAVRMDWCEALIMSNAVFDTWTDSWAWYAELPLTGAFLRWLRRKEKEAV